MAKPDSPTDSPVTSMEDFVQKHGAQAALDGIQDESAPNKPASDSSKPSEESGNLQQDPSSLQKDSKDLDAATLQALGLIPEGDAPGAPSADSGEEGDTAPPSIDPATLAQVLGIPTDDVTVSSNGVSVKTKVDGQESQVSLEELRKGYQLQKHFNRQNEEFLRQKEQWEQARHAQEAQLQQSLTVADSVLQAEEQALQKQYTRDWKALRAEDPSEYAAQVAEYNQRRDELNQRKQQVLQAFQQKQQEQHQQLQEYLSKARQDGAARLAQELNWDNQEKVETGRKQLYGYLQQTVGLQPQEIENILDHRVLVLTDKARRYDELMQKVDLSRKKVTETRSMPTGTASKPMGGKVRKLQDSMAQAKKSGRVEDAAEVFKQLPGII